jgi:hypothetical protein
VPLNETVKVTLDVTEVGRDERGAFAVASASLWCDGIRIYSADGMGMRIVSGGPPKGAPEDEAEETLRNDESTASVERPPATGSAPEPAAQPGFVLDPTVDHWLADHCPTWNRPALPMMCVADLLASAVDGTVVALRDVQVKGFVDFPGPRRLWTEIENRSAGEFVVRLFASASGDEAGPEGIEIGAGRVRVGTHEMAPAPLEAVSGSASADPYETGSLFHGPAFQLQKRAVIGAHGASAVLDAGAGSVPLGRLHPALLDAALHAIPHDQLSLWAPEIEADKVAYPARILELILHGPVPSTGEVRSEVRFDGFLVRLSGLQYAGELEFGQPGFVLQFEH